MDTREQFIAVEALTLRSEMAITITSTLTITLTSQWSIGSHDEMAMKSPTGTLGVGRRN